MSSLHPLVKQLQWSTMKGLVCSTSSVNAREKGGSLTRQPVLHACMLRRWQVAYSRVESERWQPLLPETTANGRDLYVEMPSKKKKQKNNCGGIILLQCGGNVEWAEHNPNYGWQCQLWPCIPVGYCLCIFFTKFPSLLSPRKQQAFEQMALRHIFKT